MKSLLIFITIFLFAGMGLSQTQDESELRVDLGGTEIDCATSVKLKFVEVLEDSRCPEGANCIWAGNGRIRIEVSRKEISSDFLEIETNGETRYVDFEGFRLTLKELDPYPKIDVTTNRADYKATFTITRKPE